MKVFNEENGKEKVYVQLNDIMVLTNTNKPIPASIIDKVFGREMLIVDDDNRDDFIEFEDPKEIEFFRSIDWIIDYKKYRNLSEEELKLLIKENIKEANEIATKYNSLSHEEKERNINLYERYNTLSLQNEDINKVYLMKAGKYQPIFPVVPDSNGFSLGCDDPNLPYKFSASLDPNKYLLYRTDEKEIHENDEIPGNFIQNGIMLAFMERKDIPQNGECEVSIDSIKDNKYVVINTRIMKNQNEYEVVEKEEKTGFVKRIKGFFYKKKKS